MLPPSSSPSSGSDISSDAEVMAKRRQPAYNDIDNNDDDDDELSTLCAARPPNRARKSRCRKRQTTSTSPASVDSLIDDEMGQLMRMSSLSLSSPPSSSSVRLPTATQTLVPNAQRMPSALLPSPTLPPALPQRRPEHTSTRQSARDNQRLAKDNTQRRRIPKKKRETSSSSSPSVVAPSPSPPASEPQTRRSRQTTSKKQHPPSVRKQPALPDVIVISDSDSEPDVQQTPTPALLSPSPSPTSVTKDTNYPTPFSLSSTQFDRLMELRKSAANVKGATIVLVGGQFPITRKELRILATSSWLNDEIINAYLWLCRSNLQPNACYNRVHIFSSFFLTQLYTLSADLYQYDRVARWTKNVRLCDMHSVIIPVNYTNSHWALAVIDLQRKVIRYHDSLVAFLQRAQRICAVLLQYLADEFHDKSFLPPDGHFDKHSWRVELVSDCPRQTDGSSCGLFLLAFAKTEIDQLVNGLPAAKPSPSKQSLQQAKSQTRTRSSTASPPACSFTQSMATDFRRRIAYELLQCA